MPLASVSSWARWMWGPLQHPGGALPPSGTIALVTILLAAFALRLGLGVRLPNIHHADEVYQVAEQAHRKVHGYGIKPWEFRTASRTVLLTTLVEPIYRIDGSARTRRIVQAALFCGLSLIPVWVGFRWSAGLFTVSAAVLSGSVAALWFELVHFAPKATADAVSGYFLLLGTYLARPGAPSRALVAAGLSLTLTLAMRVQIAPAVVFVLLLALAVGGRRRTVLLLTGVAAGLVAAGWTEWRWWGTPFQGQIGYLTMEFTRHSSSYFEQQPLVFYVKQYVLMYGAALPVVVFLCARGALVAPVLLAGAAAVILPFHLVGHKEYRFVMAAAPMLVVAMGLGASDLLARLCAERRRTALPLTIAAWAVGMLAVSLGDTYRPLWTRSGNHILAFEQIGRQPDACGVALVGIRWWHTPGYSGLGRDIPIYETAGTPDRTRVLEAANYVLQATKATPPPPPYVRWREFTRPVQYLYKRPGGCVAAPDLRVVRPPGIPGVAERRDGDHGEPPSVLAATR